MRAKFRCGYVGKDGEKQLVQLHMLRDPSKTAPDKGIATGIVSITVTEPNGQRYFVPGKDYELVFLPG